MELDVLCLMFLVEEYGHLFSQQMFSHCPYGNYTTKTYSFYHRTGYFTIRYLVERDDLDFYDLSVVSDQYLQLHEKLLNVWVDENEILKKHQRWLWVFRDPFFWWKKAKVLSALAEVIKRKIEKTGELYGIRVFE